MFFILKNYFFNNDVLDLQNSNSRTYLKERTHNQLLLLVVDFRDVYEDDCDCFSK